MSDFVALNQTYTADIMVTTSTLTSLAVLKVTLDEKNSDYIDYLASFVIDVLNRHKPDLITEERVSELLMSDHGLNVPRKGAQMVLRRLAKRKYLTKKNCEFFRTDKMPGFDLSEKKRKVGIKIEEVCKALSEYGYALSKKGIKWDEITSTEVILSFFDQFGIDYLRAYIFRTALPEVSKADKEEYFITASFIRYHYESDDVLFDNIMLLLKGHMLANALVCPDLESIQKDFSRVVFFFDTSLILNILNLQGVEEYGAIQELLSLIHKLKGKVFLFEHTFDEVRGILTAAENNFDDPDASGAVIREIRKSGIKKSDLILLIGNLEGNLRSLGIFTKETPKYKEEYQIGELNLRIALEQRIHYRNQRALDHDVNSIRSIYVLRQGATPRRLEDCVAVFVTENSKLAAVSYDIGKEHNSTKEVSAAITDYSLANVAWLKAPLGAPELPKKELLAACYAAMEPDENLWSKLINEMDILQEDGTISTDDHALLRVSPMATKELMNLTLGNDEALSGATVREVLERVKADLIKQKDSEIVAQREKEKKLIIERDALIENAKKRDEDDRKRETEMYWMAIKISKYVTCAIEAAVFVLLILVSFASTLLTTKYVSDSTLLTGLINGIILLGSGWSVLNWHWGISGKNVTKTTQGALQSKIFSMIKSLSAPSVK